MRFSFPRIEWALVQRLTGRATPDDGHVVGEWMAEYDPDRATPDDLYRAMDELGAPLRVRDVAWQQAAWDALVAKAAMPDETQHLRRQVLLPAAIRRRTMTSPSGTTWTRWLATGLAASAGLVGVVLIGVVVVQRWRDGHVGTAERSTFPPLTYTTGMGQRATIALPDGSRVMLNVASRLDVPSDFAAGNHVLHLDGEASFAVTHHERMPLTVVANGITTRVLGTNFVVRHYDSDVATTVAVRDGRVSVDRAGHTDAFGPARPVVLAAGDQIHVDAVGAAQIGAMDPQAFAFENGVLSLTQVSLRDAIPELNRWYDADVRLADPSLGGLVLTSRLSAGSAAELVRVLELTFDVRVERDNRVLTVYRR
jgi:transmembrane sensor